MKIFRRNIAGQNISDSPKAVTPCNWGVAWFGDREAKSGNCARCYKPGRVCKAYNGGQYLFFDVCVPCQPEVLAEQRAYRERRTDG